MRGALVGTDQEFLPLTEICQLFCQFSGIKIIILDSCYSGNIVTALRALKENGEDVSGVFALCAAGPFEQTVAVTEFSSGFEHGIFTTSLLTGSMADNKTDGSLPADRNKDNAISLMEAYFYIRSTVKNPITNQHAVMWPEGEDIILWRYDSKDDMYD